MRDTASTSSALTTVPLKCSVAGRARIPSAALALCALRVH
jgi:hypothetical protein